MHRRRATAWGWAGDTRRRVVWPAAGGGDGIGFFRGLGGRDVRVRGLFLFFSCQYRFGLSYNSTAG